ncbi:Cilia- and flagella-associated protein 57 [Batrachochytrium dendrobatidis]
MNWTNTTLQQYPLAHTHVFGLNQDVRNNICYLDEMSVVYPVGHQIAIYNTEQKTQRFISIHLDGETMNTLAVCHSNSLVAVGTKVAQSAKGSVDMEKSSSVLIYDLHSGRRKKIFTTGDAPITKEIVSIAFINDGKFLIAQGIAPDWCLYMWSLEKGKLVTWVRATASATSDVSQISCHGYDQLNTQVSVTGNNTFRVFRIVDGAFKLSYQNKIDKNILCHAWVNDSRIVAGTNDSKILIFDAGELILEISYFIPQAPKYNQDLTIQEPCNIIPTVNTLTVFSTGLLAGLSTGVGVMFEKTDDLYFYKKTNEFLLEETEFACVSLSPHEDFVVVSLKNSQIYTVSLEADSKHGDSVKFDRLSQSFHTGPIIGMDVGVSKPLLVTSGVDKSVRVWNYIDNSIEVVKYFDEIAQCIAMHPNGLYLLAGFSNTIKLMAILIDDIRPFWDSNIRGCKECRFSNGGQYFAAASNSSVMIYHTWSFEIIGYLKSTTGKIQSIRWSSDDSKILMTTVDGSVCQWSTSTFKVDSKIISNDKAVLSSVMTHDAKIIYLALNDGTIQEIVNGTFTREFPTKVGVSELLISRSGQLMFAATLRGSIRTIKFPFSSDPSLSEPDALEFNFHSQQITHLCTSFDDQYLFSCSEDGCVWIYRIDERDGQLVRRDKEWTYSDEILVTKSDQRENYRTMNELKQRVDELKAKSDAQLRIKDSSYSMKIKELIDKYSTEVNILKEATAVFQKESDKSEQARLLEIQKTKMNHKAEVAEMVELFEIKMQSEAEKYVDLQKRMEKLQNQWKSQMQDIETVHSQRMAEAASYYQKKLQEKQDVVQQAKEEFAQHKHKFETRLNEIEADVDRESLEISFDFESRLKEERESLSIISAENFSMKSKFDGLTRQIEEHKREFAKSVTEEKKLYTIIRSFEDDVVGVRKEMQERDDTIFDKEKRIYDLKKKNQELEKFKFVLDYKIVELRKQVEPREKDIIQLSDQITEMMEEIREYSQTHDRFSTEYQDLLMKHHAVQRDQSVEKWRSMQVKKIIKCFERDLSNVHGNLPDMNKAKKKLIALFQKYRNTSIDPPENPSSDLFPKLTDTELLLLLNRFDHPKSANSQHSHYIIALPNEEECNAARSREYMEKTATILKEKLAKSEAKRVDCTKKMLLENISLTSELNSLRMTIQMRKERLNNLTEARKQEKSFKQFIEQELKTHSIRELTDPSMHKVLQHKTTIPLAPVLSSIHSRLN